MKMDVELATLSTTPPKESELIGRAFMCCRLGGQNRGWYMVLKSTRIARSIFCKVKVRLGPGQIP